MMLHKGEAYLVEAVSTGCSGGEMVFDAPSDGACLAPIDRPKGGEETLPLPLVVFISQVV